MSAPKNPNGITILMPNWNHRNYLPRSVGRALETAAALARHGVECEVLVIDDDSRDGSQRLLAAMAMMDATGRLHVMNLPANRGLSGARNFAMEHCRYKWVCNADADNELIPENLIHFFNAARETQAALVYGNLVHTAEGRAFGLISNDVVHEALLHDNYIDAMAVLDVEQVMSLGGYRHHHDINAPEDWELLLHLIHEGCQIVFVPMVLGTYHVLDGSLVKEAPFKHAKVRRIYNQRKVGLPSGFYSRVYHPKLGYLI